LNLLFVGDVVGRPGRAAVRARLAELVNRHQVDFTIANGENAAGGLGLTAATAEELLDCGVDVITTGNHVWRRRELAAFIEGERRVLRPANFPPGAPGQGSDVFVTAHSGAVGVLCVVGRVFMEPLDCPFRTADREIEALRGRTNVIVVDVHAEATSEKIALGRYLDGRVSAVIGTHTHVQTADEVTLAGGTAYITDVGMTGPAESILGVTPEPVINRFLTGMPSRFQVAEGPVILNAVVVSIDTETGTARSIVRVAELTEPES
jgi:metallophosphoesterase (TIGR00282 family)